MSDLDGDGADITGDGPITDADGPIIAGVTHMEATGTDTGTDTGMDITAGVHIITITATIDIQTIIMDTDLPEEAQIAEQLLEEMQEAWEKNMKLL